MTRWRAALALILLVAFLVPSGGIARRDPARVDLLSPRFAAASDSADSAASLRGLASAMASLSSHSRGLRSELGLWLKQQERGVKDEVARLKLEAAESANKQQASEAQLLRAQAQLKLYNDRAFSTRDKLTKENATAIARARTAAATLAALNKDLALRRVVRAAASKAKAVATASARSKLQSAQAALASVAAIYRDESIAFNSSKLALDTQAAAALANASKVTAASLALMSNSSAKVASMTAKKAALADELSSLLLRVESVPAAGAIAVRNLVDAEATLQATISAINASTSMTRLSFNATMAKLRLSLAAAEASLAAAVAAAKSERESSQAAMAARVAADLEARARAEKSLADKKAAYEAQLVRIRDGIAAMVGNSTALALELEARLSRNAPLLARVESQRADLSSRLARVTALEDKLAALVAEVAALRERHRSAAAADLDARRRLRNARAAALSAENDAAEAEARTAALDAKSAALRAQESVISKNAAALRAALDSILADGAGGAEDGKVQTTLFRLGQQLESAQAEYARGQDATAAIESDAADLAIAVAKLEARVADEDRDEAALLALGLPAPGLRDTALAAVIAADEKLKDANRFAADAEDRGLKIIEALLAKRENDVQELKDQLRTLAGGSDEPSVTEPSVTLARGADALLGTSRTARAKNGTKDIDDDMEQSNTTPTIRRRRKAPLPTRFVTEVNFHPPAQ